MVVDDDKLIHKIIDKHLKDQFALQHCFSGTEALKQLKMNKPQLILLDVEMPGQNGYEVCDAIRHIKSLKNIPIIFLSGKTSLREVMLGYEAGADDYLVKPFESDLLLKKIHIHLQHSHEREELSHQKNQAEHVAMEALKGFSELGQVMLFIEQSYSITSLESLSSRFFALTNMLKLNTSLMFTLHDNAQFYSAKGLVKPLEKELFKSAKDTKRFVDFGCRTIINYPHVSVLIKNMPLDNAENYGRYKDLFPAVLGAVDAKIMALIEQSFIIEQAKKMTSSFQAIKETLVSLAGTLNTNTEKNKSHLTAMYNELEERIPRLGLEEDQEIYILNLVQTTLDKVNEETYDADTTNRKLAKVLITMQRLVNEQNHIVEEVQKESIYINNHLKNEDKADYQMDVELF